MVLDKHTHNEGHYGADLVEHDTKHYFVVRLLRFGNVNTYVAELNIPKRETRYEGYMEARQVYEKLTGLMSLLNSRGIEELFNLEG